MNTKDQVAVLLMQGWTSPIEALNKAACFSLSQRVGELAKEGHVIQKDWLTLINGKRVRIYKIETPAEAALQRMADNAAEMGLDYQ